MAPGPFASNSKEAIIPSIRPSHRLRLSSEWLSFGAVVALTIYAFRASIFCVLTDGLNDLYASLSDVGASADAELCPQTSPLFPSKNGDIWETVHETYNTDEFKDKLVDWLGSAVRIPCAKSSASASQATPTGTRC
jgi:hypothetical protein